MTKESDECANQYKKAKSWGNSKCRQSGPVCRKFQKSNAVVLSFSRGKEANSKLGIELGYDFLVLPETVFSSRVKGLGVKQVGRCLSFALSTEKDNLSWLTPGRLLVPGQSPHFIYYQELNVHS